MVIGVISADVAALRSAVNEEHHGQRFHRPLPSSGRSGGRLFSHRDALGLLRDLVPKADLLAFLVNPSNPIAESDARETSKGRRMCSDSNFLSSTPARTRF
jgi:hypothetical protein